MLLKGEKVRLRAVEHSDLEALYKWENDTASWLVSGTLTPFSRDVLIQYLATAHLDIYSTKQLRLIMEKAELPSRSIGCIDLFDFDPKNRRAGIGILVGDYTERSKGYAGEALRLLITYAFTVLDLHQLYCNITTDNETSLKLFSGQGFTITGTKKDWIFNNGTWLDEYLLQLVRPLEKRIS
jgi:diamine N-acetyltransferase